MHVEQRIKLLTAVGAFIATVVVIQLWLVAASLEALFSDETSVLIPSTIASLALFLVNLRLLAWGRGVAPKPDQRS